MHLNPSEEQKKLENNELIDHLVVALEIVQRKCARCGSSMCMGCNLDHVAREMLPDLLERAIELAAIMPNDRQEIVAEAEKSVRERDAMWRSLDDDHAEDKE